MNLRLIGDRKTGGFFKALGWALGLLLPGIVCAQDLALNGWQVASSPAKYSIEVEHPEKRMPLSLVSIFLSDPRWAGMNVAFFTDAGVPVGSELVSAVPGEAAVYLFDTSSGSKNYDAYVGAQTWVAKRLPDPKAGVRLEMRRADPAVTTSAKNLDEMLAAWNKSTAVEGVAMLNGIYEGGNRFGPQKSLLLHFQGYFEAKTNEHLDLAIVSCDASFALIDGKEVVEWPNDHFQAYDGQKGPPQGGVDVTAGLHVLDYYNYYIWKLNYWGLDATLAVKGGPFEKFTTLVPDGPFFKPIGHSHVVSFDPQGALGSSHGVPQIGISMSVVGQTYMAEERPDQCLIQLQFTCMNPISLNTVNWIFDDGTTATGNVVKHLFAHPGLRPVKVAIKSGDQVVTSLEVPVSVHQEWTQTSWGPDLNPEHEAELMKRDPMTMSGPDVASCFANFGFYHEKDAALKFLPAVIAKIKDVPVRDYCSMPEAIGFVTNENPDHYDEITQLLRGMNEQGKLEPNPSAQVVDTLGEMRMWLADDLTASTENIDEASALLESIDPSKVNNNVQHAMRIVRGEIAVAKGDFPAAQKSFNMAVGNPIGADDRSSIRKTSDIDSARAYVARQEYTTALDTLNQLVWQDARIKLDPDWVLADVQLLQERGTPKQAYLEAKRLLPVFTDSRRAQLLFRLIALAYAQGDNDLGNKCLAELLKRFPYTEEAAQAKLKWPGKP